MKYRYRVLLPVFALLALASCEDESRKEERLARQYCGSCHMFPEPALLDKKTWNDKVMPQMAFRMGFLDMSFLLHMKEDERNAVMASLPDHPMVSDEDFQRIKRYYQKHAPDSLQVPAAPPASAITQFTISPFRIPLNTTPLVTMVRVDTLHKKIYVGSRFSRLYRFSTNLTLEDSFQLPSPPADMITGSAEPELLLMGIMDPNDQARGAMVTLDSEKKFPAHIDSLQRPVHVEKADLNNDGLADYVVCAFGNYTGALVAYENKGNGRFRKHMLMPVPGARRTIVRDFDNNGMPDIAALLTQGDEKIVLLHNKGNFDFRVTTLLRFPPVYGSSYFEVADFNHDGKFDIVYTNGDNADYSPVLKAYHGVRLFLNEGTNTFKEAWFHPMHGASQARVADFDADGDLDIAAIAFFPDFSTHAEHGFMYFENTGGTFTAQTTPLGTTGRWITMEIADLDADGDTDLLLGALDFEPGVSQALLDEWARNRTSLLVLRNNRR